MQVACGGYHQVFPEHGGCTQTLTHTRFHPHVQVACGGDHTLVVTCGTVAAGAVGLSRTAAAAPSSGAGAQSAQGNGHGVGNSGSSGGITPGEAAALAACEGSGVLYAFGRGTWGATGLGGTDNTFR